VIKVLFALLAAEDLEDISRYIGGELLNPQAARDISTQILRHIDSLADNPSMGPTLVRAGHATEYRTLTCGHYRVVYRVDGEAVRIIRILYVHRDMERALFGVLDDKNEPSEDE
jgi:toxin ParE1/3/4